MPYGTSGTGGVTAASAGGALPLATSPLQTLTPQTLTAPSTGSLIQTTPLAGGTAADQIVNDVVTIIATIFEMAMGQSLDPASPLALAGTAAAGGGAGTAAVGQGIAADGRVLANTDPTRTTIVQIDSFTTDETGFNHGEEVGQTILAGSNAATTDLIQLDAGPSVAGIADNLEQVLARMDQGQDYDAINISLGADVGNADAARVQQLVDEFAARGVAVNISAGNDGPGVANGLATQNAFIVANTENGQLDAASGTGNVTAEGRTTSFATAAFTAQAAAAVNAGATLDSIRTSGPAAAAAGGGAGTLAAPPTAASGGASAITAEQRLAGQTTADANATALIQNALGVPATPAATPAAAPAADMTSMVMDLVMSLIRMILG